MYYYKGDNMKAVVKTEVGFDNMVYKEVEEPKAERDLVKIKIAYSGICGTDLEVYTEAKNLLLY